VAAQVHREGKARCAGGDVTASYAVDTVSGPMVSTSTLDLLVVDEAERLSPPALEHLRDRFDRRDLGLLLIGMPGIEKRLARYPQLYSRMGFAHQYNRPLGDDELAFVLTRHWKRLGLTLDLTDFTDAQAVAAVGRITRRQLPPGPPTVRPDRAGHADQQPGRPHQRHRRGRPEHPRHRRHIAPPEQRPTAAGHNDRQVTGVGNPRPESTPKNGALHYIPTHTHRLRQGLHEFAAG